jgi:hypothetical protein
MSSTLSPATPSYSAASLYILAGKQFPRFHSLHLGTLIGYILDGHRQLSDLNQEVAGAVGDAQAGVAHFPIIGPAVVIAMMTAALNMQACRTGRITLSEYLQKGRRAGFPCIDCNGCGMGRQSHLKGT